MTLDARIILGGQPVNVLGALMGGAQAAGAVNDVARSNALGAYYRDNGAGILAGEGNALNGLAGLDPMAALGVRGAIAGERRADAALAMDQERLNMAKEQAKQAAAQWAAQQDAAVVAQRAQQTAAMMKSLAVAHAQGNQQLYDSILTQHGENPAAMPFDQFPALAAATEGVLEVWQQMQPQAPEPLSKEGKLAADFRAGLITGEQYQQAQQADGMTVYDPATGNPIMTQGRPPLKLTEQQSKDVVFYERMTGVSPLLDRFEGALTSYQDSIAGNVPLIGNSLVSPEFQQAQQAGREWLAGVLRKDTGAAVTEGELQLYGPMYLPQPGDSPEVLAQKRSARQRAESAIRRGLGTAEVLAQEIDAERAAEGANRFSGMSRDDILNFDYMSLSGAELDAFEARMKELGIGGQ